MGTKRHVILNTIDYMIVYIEKYRISQKRFSGWKCPLNPPKFMNPKEKSYGLQLMNKTIHLGKFINN